MDKAVVVHKEGEAAEVLSTCCGAQVTATITSRDFGVPIRPDGYCTLDGSGSESEVLRMHCQGCRKEIEQDFEWM